MNRDQILAASSIVAVTVFASIVLFVDRRDADAPPAPIEIESIAIGTAPPVAVETVEPFVDLEPELLTATELRRRIAEAQIAEPQPAAHTAQGFARASEAALVSPGCPAVPRYYPDARGCHARDISVEAGPSSCLRYRHGDTLWRRELGGRVEFCVTPSRTIGNDAPGYVEFGVPFALMGGGRIDQHDPRTVREEHVSPLNRMTRRFSRAWLASQASPPVPDFDVVIAISDLGTRHESLYVRCAPMTWQMIDRRTGATKSGADETCEAEWVYLPSLMSSVQRFEPAKVGR